MGNEAKFKVGDRIRITRHGAYQGGVGHITEDECVGSRPLKIRLDPGQDFRGFDNGTVWVDRHEIDYAPLRIREGAYYRTRDGRKVGPAETTGGSLYPWNVPHSDVFYGYTADGKSCIGVDKDDLIAEWADEHTYNANPAAEVDNLRDEYGPGDNDNGTATKFKVGEEVAYVNPEFGTAKVLEVVDDEHVKVDTRGMYGICTEHVKDLRLVAPATSGKDGDEPDTKLIVSISADTSALDSEIDRVLKRLRKLKRKARKLGISLEYSELRDAA